MQTYKAPLRDMRFVLQEMYGTQELTEKLGFEDASEDLCDTILEEAAKVCRGGAAAAERQRRPRRLPLRERRRAHAEGLSAKPTTSFAKVVGPPSMPTRNTAARACPSRSPSRSRRCSARPIWRSASIPA